MSNDNYNSGVNKTPEFKYLQKYSNVLDSRIRIPGTDFRFGWDPILGFVPVVGDTISLGFSILLIYYFFKHGGTRKMALKMSGNVLLDATVGSIPILGTVSILYTKPMTEITPC